MHNIDRWPPHMHTHVHRPTLPSVYPHTEHTHVHTLKKGQKNVFISTNNFPSHKRQPESGDKIKDFLKPSNLGSNLAFTTYFQVCSLGKLTNHSGLGSSSIKWRQQRLLIDRLWELNEMKDANGLKPHGRLQRLLVVTTTAVTSSWSSVRRSPPCAAVILLQMTKDGIICCPSFHSAERSMVKEPTFTRRREKPLTHIGKWLANKPDSPS